MSINATHDPHLKSWVESANGGSTDFPVQNLPHGVFRRKGSAEVFRGGVAIGDQIVDLDAAVACGAFTSAAARAAAQPALNDFMAMGQPAWHTLRAELSRGLQHGAPQAPLLRQCLVAQVEAEHAVPARIGDYTDFFTSHHHMLNAGRVFNPDAGVLPQFYSLPIGYHGRASSITVSGSAFRRPWGQGRAPGAAEPYYGPSRALDYELELGAYIGPGNAHGEPVGIDEAVRRLFGVCLLNDWSARDVQGWESNPLGPFLAKSFITTVSPWIVTMEALAPFGCVPVRPAGTAALLPYLSPNDPACGLALELEVWIETKRSAGQPMRISCTNSRHGAWGLAQMLAHHTENGCNMNPGDLIGSGTQSGPTDAEKGCLLELSFGGREPITLPNGEARAMLEDGDTVILRGWAEREGFARIGLGECRGAVLAARTH